jgi:undecaprenyl-diphosphatase
VARITAEYLPLIFAVWLVILWLKKEKIYKNIALLAGYSMLTDLSLNFMVTIFYFHPRPFMEDMGILLVQHAAETSFPSDHATLMLSIASTLVFFEQSCMQGIILFVLGLLGGLARVFCGLHFPLDIVGSLLIATLSSICIFRIRTHLSCLNDPVIRFFDYSSRRIKAQLSRDHHVQ